MGKCDWCGKEVEEKELNEARVEVQDATGRLRKVLSYGDDRVCQGCNEAFFRGFSFAHVYGRSTGGV